MMFVDSSVWIDYFNGRETIDVMIGTFCLANSLELLHADADFDPMEAHLGLQVVRLVSGNFTS